MNRNSLIALLFTAGILIVWQSCKSDDDTDLPYILLEGPNPYYIDSIGGTFVEPGFKSVDDVDGDLTANVIVTYPSIQSDSAKTYEAIYQVTDHSGNTFTTKRSIIVRNTNFFLEGFYSNCSQICDTTIDTLFAASVITSVNSNGQFYISNFGNFGYGMDVLASLDPLTQKIIINTPQPLTDSSTLDFVDSDSTYYTIVNDTLRFQVSFIHSKNGESDTCKTYYRK
jgi:hypothetical protein